MMSVKWGVTKLRQPTDLSKKEYRTLFYCLQTTLLSGKNFVNATVIVIQTYIHIYKLDALNLKLELSITCWEVDAQFCTLLLKIIHDHTRCKPSQCHNVINAGEALTTYFFTRYQCIYVTLFLQHRFSFFIFVFIYIFHEIQLWNTHPHLTQFQW
jgi:hypothetical protein